LLHANFTNRVVGIFRLRLYRSWQTFLRTAIGFLRRMTELPAIIKYTQNHHNGHFLRSAGSAAGFGTYLFTRWMPFPSPTKALKAVTWCLQIKRNKFPVDFQDTF